MAREKLLQKVAKHEWMQTIDLGQGVVTLGRLPVNKNIMSAYDYIDFKGMKELDLGTCNGLWSFEAESRRAAEIYSIDHPTHVCNWCMPAYQLAHQALDSKARYFPDMNVYDVEQLGITEFDVVIFSGLYSHLASPLLALSKLRCVMKEGGRIVIEGPAYPDTELSYSCFHYQDLSADDKSNWCMPRQLCLRDWVECSYFEIEAELLDQAFPSGARNKLKTAIRAGLGKPFYESMRVVMQARAKLRNDPLYSAPIPIPISRPSIADRTGN